jgi:membrane protease YdiL (CAAX protease family)
MANTPVTHTETTGLARSPFAEWVAAHQLLAFFLMAFGYTWIYQVFVAQVAPTLFHDPMLYIPSIYGPTIAALLLHLITGGPAGLVDFLRRSLRWRIPLYWYAVALFGIPFLLLVVRGLHSLLFPAISIAILQLPQPVTGILFGYLMSLPYGPLGEELGWRGVALPQMQKRMHPFAASLLLGVIWWVWHLPQLLLPELEWAVGGMSPLLYLLMIVPGSMLVTWLYNVTKGGVLPVILMHGSFNFGMGLLGFNSPYFLQLTIGVFWVTALLVSLVSGSRLSRSKV